MRKRSELDDQKKTYQSTDRVNVLGVVCERMTKRVMLADKLMEMTGWTVTDK